LTARPKKPRLIGVATARRERERVRRPREEEIDCSPDAVRVCLAVTHPLVEGYLSQILKEAKGLVLLSFREFQQHPQTIPPPNVIVLDITTATTPLAQWVRALRTRFPTTKFLSLGGDPSESAILKLLFLGIHGFLSYDDIESSLVQAVKSIAAGRVWAPRQVLQRYVEISSQMLQTGPKASGGLTKRESEILGLLFRHLANKEIADALHIRESTVKFHVANIFEKFQVHDRSSLQERLERQQYLEDSLAAEHA
jgi:DNA-binding NarL/FixJ family response regulator